MNLVSILPNLCVCEKPGFFPVNHEGCSKSVEPGGQTSFSLYYENPSNHFWSKRLRVFTLFSIYILPDAWYVMTGGSDTEGCGRAERPCQTLRFLLLQVNRTHLPPDKELRIVTDKSLRIDQRTAVSTIWFLCINLKQKKPWNWVELRLQGSLREFNLVLPLFSLLNLSNLLKY